MNGLMGVTTLNSNVHSIHVCKLDFPTKRQTDFICCQTTVLVQCCSNKGFEMNPGNINTHLDLLVLFVQILTAIFHQSLLQFVMEKWHDHHIDLRVSCVQYDIVHTCVIIIHSDPLTWSIQ